MSFLYKFNLDYAGMAASILCALHCIALPLFLSLGMTTGSELFHDHSFDIIIIAIGVVIASLSLITDYKKHKSLIPILTIAIGFITLIYGLRSGHGWIHAGISIVGSILVTTAHVINWRRARAVKSE